MVLLFPPILLLVISLTLFIFRLRRIRPAISWLVGISGVLIAWILVLVLHSQIPSTFNLPTWQLTDFSTLSPQLILDEFSWPHAVSITTLALVGMLVSLVNQASLARGSDGWKEWVVIAAVSGASLLAIFPADLVSLIITWTVLDLVECCFWIGAGNSPPSGARPVIYLTSRLVGTFLVVWAAVISLANGYPLSLQQLNPVLAPLLLIALGIRTCVLPLNLLSTTASKTNGPHAVLLALAPQAASLVLASRIAPLSSPGDLRLWLLLLSWFTLFSSITWFSASSPERVRGSWLAVVSGLVLAASSQSLAGASLAWGCVLTLSGGLIFFASRQVKLIQALLVLGAFSLSSLPFSLTWQGASLYGNSMGAAGWIFLVAQLFLLAGYLRFSWIKRQSISPAEPWKPVLYFSGLSLLPLMAVAISFLDPVLSAAEMQPSLAQSWPAFLLAALCVGGAIVTRRFKFNLTRVEEISRKILSMDWFGKVGKWLFHLFSQLFSMLNFVLEGQAGVLWAFLIFILLISLMAQFGTGG